MIALARKYRPKKFADLIVQEHIAAALRGAVAGGRVAHGYLFAGPRGVGKTTAARILAMALNCERRGSGTAGEPCGECDSCTRVWTGAVDLDVLGLEAASNRGVDDARDLRERAMYAASGEGRHKVYIVDEAHMLTREAWNALLKILGSRPHASCSCSPRRSRRRSRRPPLRFSHACSVSISDGSDPTRSSIACGTWSAPRGSPRTTRRCT